MDPVRFDALARVLSVPDSRRRVLGLLTAVPNVGGLLGLLTTEETEAAGRRKRRKKAHKHGKGRRRKHHKKKKKCTSESVAQTCAGRCGSVTNTCKQTVDCGSCACTPACDVCFTCQEGPNTPGTCVVDPAQQGQTCGAAGQVCQADGTCACDAGSCPDCSTCGVDGTCTPCTDCCDGAGVCQDGDTNAACGSSGTCDVCTGQAQCQGQTCVCTPDCAGKACGASDGCSGTCQTGPCPECQTCSAGSCLPETNGITCSFPNFGFTAIGQCQNGTCTCRPSGASCLCNDGPSLAGCCSGTCTTAPGGFDCIQDGICA